MNLFYFNYNKYNPFIFIIVKIDNETEMELIEAWANELFQILIDENKATLHNILIFSIIKNYEEQTINLILPSTKSNNKLVTECENNTELLNKAIVDTLLHIDSEFYFEITNNKIKMHLIHVGLPSFAEYYNI